VAVEREEASATPTADGALELAELARLQRRLGDDDAAEATLELARAIAAKIPDAAAVLERIDTIAARQ
jgi:hypothetical protein